MRCNNCGWDNSSGLAKCEKCNAPLKGSMVEQNGHISGANKSDNGITGTIRGKQAEQKDYIDQENVEKEGERNAGEQTGPLTNCEQCGYPLVPGAVTCPDCGTNIKPSEGDERKLEPNPAPGGTINPWQQAQKNKCYLKAIERDGEKAFQPTEFSGDEIILNRANLENENFTITRKTQAIIKNINGKWFIEDGSAGQTTFIHISKRVEIKRGDIILMGNRKFQFDC